MTEIEARTIDTQYDELLNSIRNNYSKENVILLIEFILNNTDRITNIQKNEAGLILFGFRHLIWLDGLIEWQDNIKYENKV